MKTLRHLLLSLFALAACDPQAADLETEAEAAPLPSLPGKADELEEDRGVPSDAALDDLASLSAQEIEEVFAAGLADRIPNGVGYGRSIVLPGSSFANGLADDLWFGKTFDADELFVINRTKAGDLFRAGVEVDSLEGFLGYRVNRVRYYFKPWKTFPENDQPSIIVDYSAEANPEVPFSFLLVDQVRRVWTDEYENLYLGRLMIRTPFGPQLTNYFALSFPESVALEDL
jgi:hypothetical protein